MVNIKEGTEKEYQRLSDRLFIVKNELTMKHMLNGWLVKEYEAELKQLIKHINDCINEKN